jgi:homoserine kinase
MRVTASVPATSANLGPGFDSFGIALSIRNTAVADTAAPPGVSWRGEGADELPTDGSDLVSRTMGDVADRMGERLPPLALHCENRIPLARGLGSSSAAIVMGVVLASSVLELGLEREPDSVFEIAADLEGHPDNVAPAIYGGFTVAVPDGPVRRFATHPDLRSVVVLVPPDRLLTADARAALPDVVPLADAVYNLAHAAILVEALTRTPELLPFALRDRLHQDARLALVPKVRDVFDELQRDGVAVCVSGAGPSLLAFGPVDADPGRFGTTRILPAQVSDEGFRLDA